VVVNGAFGALDAAWPDHPLGPYKAEVIGWGVVAVGAISGYFTRNRV
jgi:hypothetical protein